MRVSVEVILRFIGLTPTFPIAVVNLGHLGARGQLVHQTVAIKAERGAAFLSNGGKQGKEERIALTAVTGDFPYIGAWIKLPLLGVAAHIKLLMKEILKMMSGKQGAPRIFLYVFVIKLIETFLVVLKGIQFFRRPSATVFFKPTRFFGSPVGAFPVGLVLPTGGEASGVLIGIPDVIAIMYCGIGIVLESSAEKRFYLVISKISGFEIECLGKGRLHGIESAAERPHPVVRVLRR